MQLRDIAGLAVAGLAVLTGVGAHAGEAAQAQPEMAWLLDDKGCKVANPYPRPGATVRWSGSCVDGWAEGSGTLQWLLKGKPTLQYAGALTHGLSQGEGVSLWPNGDRYEGAFVKGARTGHGAIRLADGSRYEGDFSRGQFQGQGVLTWADGRAFDGQFEQGQPDGRGVYVSADGRRTNARAREGFIVAVGLGLNDELPTAPRPVSVVDGAPIREPSLAMQRCPTFAPPRFPGVEWVGTASYFATVSVIADRVASVAVRPIQSSEDPDVDEQFIAAIVRSLKQYECKGSFVFGQEFVVRVK